MGVGQLSESDAVDALRLPFYSSSHPTGSHGWRNQFDLGNPELKDLGSRFLDFLLPPRCTGCGQEGHLLCDSCSSLLPPLNPPTCSICASPSGGGDLCSRCQVSPLAVDGIRSPFLMDGVAQRVVHHLKYVNVRSLAPIMAALMSAHIRESPLPVQVVVPVPLHPRRERERGYNQAFLLAREVSRTLELPMDRSCLVRVKNSPPQAAASTIEERRTNVADSFEAVHSIHGAGVLLIDDVCTTAATIEACAIALRKAGASSVWGLTFAKTV